VLKGHIVVVADLEIVCNIEFCSQCDARLTVTFPAIEHYCRLTGTKLHCLVIEARVCVNNLKMLLVAVLIVVKVSN